MVVSHDILRKHINLSLECGISDFCYAALTQAFLHHLLDKRMFRVFGHARVWVLDGGLPRWRASGYDVESSASGDAILKASAASEAIENVYKGQVVSLRYFQMAKHVIPSYIN